VILRVKELTEAFIDLSSKQQAANNFAQKDEEGMKRCEQINDDLTNLTKFMKECKVEVPVPAEIEEIMARRIKEIEKENK